MFAAINEAVRSAEQQAANQSAGMMDLFGEVIPGGDSDADPYENFHGVRSGSVKERLQAEKDTLGLYLTGHPIDEYEHELEHHVSARVVDLKPEKHAQTVAGLVVASRVMRTKRGDNRAFITLDDRTGRIEVTVFSDSYNEARDLLLKDRLLVVTGQDHQEDYSGKLKKSAETK